MSEHIKQVLAAHHAVIGKTNHVHHTFGNGPARDEAIARCKEAEQAFSDALESAIAAAYTKAQRETAALCAYLCKDMPGGEAIAEKINGICKEGVLPYRMVRYDLSAAEQESELREQLILMGWMPPPPTLPNSITGKKWQQLCQQGYQANGIAFCKGDEQGLITDFGKVLWWKQEEDKQP